jgi:amylosucrase/maltose alpha-D-glucosyltransferase/alpha-amylase
VERALEGDDAEDLELAVQRVLLIHGVTMTMSGIPMIYLGDEIAMLNDYSYEQSGDKAGDSRWLHRARFDWERAELRHDPKTVPGAVYHGLMRLVRIRNQTKALRGTEMQVANTGNPHVFGFVRTFGDSTAFVLGNFSEREQRLEARRLRQIGLRKTAIDLYAGQTVTATRELVLAPYQLMVLSRAGGTP